MTSPPARSCLACTGELTPYAGFCPTCGTPAPPSGSSDHAAFRRPGDRPTSPPPATPSAVPSAVPVAAPPPSPLSADVVEAGPTGPTGPIGRTGTAIMACVVAVAVLAVVGVVAVTTWGEGDVEVYGYGGRPGLPAAVTEEPDEEWSWRVESELTGLAALEDSTYVATQDGTVTALDDAGDEEWTADVGGPGFLLASPDHEDVVIFDNVNRSLVAALSAEDGRVLWTVPGDAQWFDDDSFYVATDDALMRYDLASGDELWSADAERVGVGEAGVFVLAGGELRSVDTDDGATRWAVDVDSPDDSTSLAVADDFVAVGGAGAAAYEATGGDRLWSAAGGDGGAEVQLFSRREVLVQPVGSATGGQELPVYDRRGETATVDTDRMLYFVAFGSGGDQYTFDFGTGDLYGDDHRVVATYDGRPALAAEGLYALDGGEISYYEYGEADPGWTLDDVSDEANVATGEGRLLIVADRLLTSYR